MQEYSYGLLRIMLIDSFLPKRTYEVNLTGNTNITGDNGLGKTSLIKLPVIFYGANPTDVNIKENKETNYKGFSGRYLPRDGSYVVFEYVAKNEKKCVVFLPDANSEEGICRYFIDSPYDHELFFENEGNSPRSRNAFLQQLELNNITKYRPKSFTEYRTILLDGTQIKQMQFSMVPRGARLSKLHNLFTGMLNRSADFSVLGRIISDWAHSDIPRDATEALEKFKLDKTQLKSWLNDHRSQSLFNKLINSVGLEKLQENYEQLKESSAQLDATRVCSVSRSKQLSENLKSKQDHFNQQHKNLKDEEAAINKLYEDANNAVITEEKRSARINTEMGALDRTHATFTDKLGDDYQTRLSQLQKYTEDKQQLKVQFSTVSSVSLDIKSDFDELFKSTENTHTDLIRKFENELSGAKLEHATNTKEININAGKKRSELGGQYQKNKSLLDEKKRQYDIREVQLNNTIKNPIIDDDLTDILANADTSYEAASNTRDELQDKTDAVQSKYIKAKSSFNETNNEIERVGKELDEVISELDDIQAALNVHDDSLLAFLKKNVPDWHRTFGKVFSQKALLNRKLTPEKVDENHDTAFGLSLDVNAISDSEAFDAASLTEREQILLEEQTYLENNIGRLDKELNIANKMRLDAENLVNEHNKAKRQNKRDLADKKAIRDSAKSEVNKAKRRTVSDATTRLDKLKQVLIPEIELEYSQLNKIYTQEQKAVDDDEEIQVLSEDKKLKTTETRLKQETEAANNKKEKRIEELSYQRDKKLSDAGIDVSLLSKLKTKIEELDKEITTLTVLKQIYEAFNKFKSNDYCAYGQLQLDKKASDKAFSLKKQQRTLLYNELSNKRKEIDVLEKEVHQIQKNTETALSNYQFIINDASQYEFSNIDNIRVGFDTKLTAMDVKRRYESYKNTFITTKKLLASSLNHFREFFNRDLVKGTPIHDYWITHDHSEERVLTTALVIISYIKDGNQDNDIRSLKHNLNQLDKLNSFVTYISNFGSKMRFFNERLDEHMEQVTEFDSLKSLTANLQFTLANEATFKDMKALSDKYTEFKESERGTFSLGDSAKPELPPEWLISSIEDFIENSNETLKIDDLAQYIDFRITFNDKGETRDIRTAKFLKDASSNALSYLVLVVLFVGFVNMIRQTQNITLTWAVDELLDIHTNNIERLLELLGSNNINMISACPGVDEQVFGLFDKTYEIFEEPNRSVVLRDYDDGLSSDDYVSQLLTELTNSSEVTT